MKSFLITIVLLSSSVFAAGSIAGTLIEQNVKNIEMEENLCLAQPEAGSITYMNQCILRARVAYIDELSNISAAFIALDEGKLLLLADSEKKWGESIQAICKLSVSNMDDRGQNKELIYNNCEKKAVKDRVEQMVKIYNQHLN
jgi:hypothetical protein